MKLGIARVLGWTLLMVTAGLACGETTTAASSSPLEVGTLTSVSGDLASLGLEFNDATSLAVEDINANGGVLDRPVKLVVQDDGTSVEGAKAGYTQLLASRVPVVLGPTTSAQVSALVDLMASGNTLTIGRTTTADQLTDLEDNNFFFRLTPADVHQAKILADLVAQSGVESLCLVHRRDVYGKNLSTSVTKALEASGKKVSTTLADYDASSSDLSAVMDKCAALVCPPGGSDAGAGDAGAPCSAPKPAKVGLMLITFIEDGALILDDAAKKGWSAKGQKFFFADGVYDRGLLTRVKDVGNIQGGLGTAPAGPDPDFPGGEQLRKFVGRYKQRYGREPSIFVENAFDAMYVAAIAMEISKSAVPGTAIRDAMSQVSVPGGKKVSAGDWASIRAAIRAGEAIDFEGASGPCDFDAKGDVKPPYTYVVWRVDAGGLTVAERRTIAQ
jgi:branched-chain amino acid transport system substrate-binding protein